LLSCFCHGGGGVGIVALAVVFVVLAVAPNMWFLFSVTPEMATALAW
jgi:hypothetical protein